VNDTIRLLLDHIETPIGTLALLADEAGHLHALGFTDGHARMERQLLATVRTGRASLVTAANPGGLSVAVGRYFAGDLRAIDGLPVVMTGTPFQRAVWTALRDIPCGETRSYGEIARRIGRPSAVRAVGLANGANPVGIVVPCHRVIGANGTLTGYGGGVERKHWLLAHEGQPVAHVAERGRGRRRPRRLGEPTPGERVGRATSADLFTERLHRLSPSVSGA
jgi:methylated-DNA-[protein]-cysteine S-methyltransferase